MSVEAIATVLHHSRATKTAKLVLVGIANHEGDGGAFPSVATLAKYGGCSERQVQRYIAALVELGELRVLAQAGGSSDARRDRRPNLYRVLVRCPDWCDGTTQHRRRGDTSDTPKPDGVTSMTQRGDTDDANGVTPMSPEPSLEPSKKPKVRASAIPDGWRPSPAVADEMAQRYPTLQIGQEAEKFTDWHGAKGNTFVDHDKAFRNWCRKAAEYAAKNSREPGKVSSIGTGGIYL
jgi:hypothetical protein